MKNFIVILNIVGFPKLIQVDNFEDDNVKKALQETFGVDVNNLECLTQGSPVIYGVKEKTPKLVNSLNSVNVHYAEHPSRHEHYFHVLYAVQ